MNARKSARLTLTQRRQGHQGWGGVGAEKTSVKDWPHGQSACGEKRARQRLEESKEAEYFIQYLLTESARSGFSELPAPTLPKALNCICQHETSHQPRQLYVPGAADSHTHLRAHTAHLPSQAKMGAGGAQNYRRMYVDLQS